LNALLLPDSSVAAVAVRVNGPYVPEDPPSAAAQSGVHVITPVLGASDAPLGSAGLTDHVSGPSAQLVSDAEGVMVSVDSSATVCGVEMAATVTVPTRCATTMVNALLFPDSSVAAVAVSVKGP